MGEGSRNSCLIAWQALTVNVAGRLELENHFAAIIIKIGSDSEC